MFLSSLYLHAYEESSAEEDMLSYYKHYRLSNYVSAGCAFNDHVQGTLTTHFQPHIERWPDCRISLVSIIRVQLKGTTGLSISGTFIYDIQTPINVPKPVYDLPTGLTVSW